MNPVGVAGRVACGLLGSAAALAVPRAQDPPDARVICSGCGICESAIVDEQGRLFFTSQTRRALLVLEPPDTRPHPVTVGINSPGGLAWAGDGRLIVGFGNSPLGGLTGTLAPRAGLLLVDPATGEREPWIHGLGMANGVARDPAGDVFASNDLGTHIERVTPGGAVERRWAKVPSANGLAIDGSGRYLYAAQTFTRAAIKRVEIAHPEVVTTHAQPSLPAAAALLDGMAIDNAGVLYVAANGAGQIWRVATDGRLAAIAGGLSFPSAIAIGHGTAYVVTFAGQVVELTPLGP